MKRIVAFCFSILAFSACNKDKVETKPHVTFKSFNTDVVELNETLRVTLDFTDQEGDLDSLFIVRERLNSRGPSYKLLPYGIPEFNGETRGQLLITMQYQQDIVVNLNALRIPGSNPPAYEADTLQLKFYVKDRAGNISDSTSPKQLIVIR